MNSKKNQLIDKRAIAENLYYSGMSQKQIAEMLSVTENTVGNWKRTEGWDDIKTIILGSGYKIVASIYKRVLKEVTDKPDSFDMDFMAKAAKGIQMFMPRTSVNLDTYNKSFQEFSSWAMKKHGVAKAKESLEMMEEFMSDLVNQQL